MKIGELFVNLTTKGSKETGRQVGAVAKQLDGARRMSLEAKAAIVGVIYGFQQLMSWGGKTGASLSQFETITGQSAETLQRWQGVGRAFNVEATSMQDSVGALNKILVGLMTATGELPVHFDRISQKVGLTEDMFGDTFKVMEKLQEYAQSDEEHGIKVQALQNAGMADDVIQSLIRGVYTKEKLAATPVISKGQLKSLADMNAMWSEIANKMQMAFAKLLSKDGGKVMKSLKDAAYALTDAVTALGELASDSGILSGVSKILGGWSMLFKQINAEIDRLKGAKKDPEQQKLFNDPKNMGISEWFFRGGMFRGDAILDNYDKKIMGKQDSQADLDRRLNAKPSRPVTINQTVNVTGSGLKPSEIKESVGQGNNNLKGILQQFATGEAN